jgi:hypothetical protein
MGNKALQSASALTWQEDKTDRSAIKKELVRWVPKSALGKKSPKPRGR